MSSRSANKRATQDSNEAETRSRDRNYVHEDLKQDAQDQGLDNKVRSHNRKMAANQTSTVSADRAENVDDVERTRASENRDSSSSSSSSSSDDDRDNDQQQQRSSKTRSAQNKAARESCDSDVCDNTSQQRSANKKLSQRSNQNKASTTPAAATAAAADAVNDPTPRLNDQGTIPERDTGVETPSQSQRSSQRRQDRSQQDKHE